MQQTNASKTESNKKKYLIKLLLIQSLFCPSFMVFIFKYADVYLNGSQSQYEAQIISLMKTYLITLVSK